MKGYLFCQKWYIEGFGPWSGVSVTFAGHMIEVAEVTERIMRTHNNTGQSSDH